MGYLKEGDKVITTRDTWFRKGTICTVVKVDGTDCPLVEDIATKRRLWIDERELDILSEIKESSTPIIENKEIKDELLLLC